MASPVVTIPVSTAQSDAVVPNINSVKYGAVGIVLPITTGTVFTFAVAKDAADGSRTFVPLKDAAGNLVSVTKAAATASAHVIDANWLVGWDAIRVNSNATELAERAITFVLYPV